eukprot:746189-Hanusia_phi.AAC.4
MQELLTADGFQLFLALVEARQDAVVEGSGAVVLGEKRLPSVRLVVGRGQPFALSLGMQQRASRAGSLSLGMQQRASRAGSRQVLHACCRLSFPFSSPSQPFSSSSAAELALPWSTARLTDLERD